MYTYKVILKDGTSEDAECDWTGLLAVESMLDDSKHFIRIGSKFFAKNFIAEICKIETKEE